MSKEPNLKRMSIEEINEIKIDAYMSKEQTPINSERIREIQESTAYPNSVSVQQALLQVWNECEQYHRKHTKAKVLEALDVNNQFKVLQDTLNEMMTGFDSEDDKIDFILDICNGYKKRITKQK